MCALKGYDEGGGDPKQAWAILVPRRAQSDIRTVDCSSCGGGDGGGGEDRRKSDCVSRLCLERSSRFGLQVQEQMYRAKKYRPCSILLECCSCRLRYKVGSLCDTLVATSRMLT